VLAHRLWSHDDLLCVLMVGSEECRWRLDIIQMLIIRFCYLLVIIKQGSSWCKALMLSTRVGHKLSPTLHWNLLS